MKRQSAEGWAILPFVGLGPLRFSTPRVSVRAMLESEFRSVFLLRRKGRRPETEAVDIYDSLGVALRYDNDDTLVFIEASPPCQPTIDDIILLGQNLDAIMEMLEIAGRTGTSGDIGCQYDNDGFGLYTELSDTILSVIVFRKDYYDIP